MKLSPVTEIAIDELSRDSLPTGAARLRLIAGHDLRGAIALPALSVNGAAAGPLLLAVAGIHGNEYEGMEAIRAVFQTLDPAALHGTFLGIVIANPFAWEARTRPAPPQVDGLNLARIFPGNPAGTPSLALAARLLSLAQRLVGPEDLVLDLHSGTAEIAYASLVGVRDIPSPAAGRSHEAARRFGFDRLWQIPGSAGPFNAETTRLGIPTIGTETTGRAGCDPADVKRYAEGIQNLLAWLGITPERPLPEPNRTPFRRTTDVPAPVSGFARAIPVLDAALRVGDPVAEIVDPFGDPLAVVTTPVSGAVWARRMTPAVLQGEMLCMIAHTE